MQRLKIIILLAPLVATLMLQSCKKGYFEGVNDSPNSPTSVSPNLLLPAGEAGISYTLGGDIQRYTGLMSQYIVGSDRQFSGYQTYNFTEEDFNNLWNNLYINTMKTIDGIRAISTNEPGRYDGYNAVAQILMAYCLAATTDLWGDIPYNEAFLGSENLKPAYESQQQIYTDIQQLLSDAITTLGNQATLDDDASLPGADDFIYEGDLNAWLSLAHALKARNYLHVVNADPSAVASALTEINAGEAITDATFQFSSTGPNPWYQYIEQRGDITYEDATVIGFMTGREDPRLEVYIEDGSLGTFFSGESAPVALMTEFERKFIEAEVKLRSSDLGGAQTAFTEALQANFDYYGVDGSSYMATYGTLNSGTEMEQIITEKWVANYLSSESWNDWRRTDFPVLAPNNGVSIPRRFIYPTGERLYNNNPTNNSSNMFTPQLWWDM